MRHSLEIDSSSIHHSQLRIIAAMLNKGLPDEEVVEKVMAATKTAAGECGRNWNWEDEQRKIRNMILGWHESLDHLDESALYALDTFTGNVIWQLDRYPGLSEQLADELGAAHAAGWRCQNCRSPEPVATAIHERCAHCTPSSWPPSRTSATGSQVH
jgi:hypothetical protein